MEKKQEKGIEQILGLSPQTGPQTKFEKFHKREKTQNAG